jgi:hypothetical protein
MRCTARMIIDRFYTILHQRTVPYTHIDRSSEETAMPDFAEDPVVDQSSLRACALTDLTCLLFPSHDYSLITTPSLGISIDVAIDVAVDVDVGSLSKVVTNSPILGS